MTLESALARDAITTTLALHSRGVDRADAGMIAAAYLPDARVDYGFFSGTAAELSTVLGTAMATAGPTLHRCAPPMIGLAGDQAVSESYVIAYTGDPGTQRLVFGRYLDRLERRDDAWLIAHRLYVMDGNVNRPNATIPATPALTPDHFVPEGAKGASDPGRALLTCYHATALARQGTLPMSNNGQNPDAAQAAIDTLVSRAAIQNLIAAYCRGVDRADEDLLRSLFWDDGTMISGVINGPAADFARGITEYCPANMEYCFHSVANVWLDVKGDHAVGEIYVLAHFSAGGQDVMSGGRYLDRYERREGVWKIASRVFVADWNTMHPASMALDGMYEPLKTRGAFGKADPVYAHWASI